MTKEEIEELIEKELKNLKMMAKFRELTNESESEYQKKVDYYLDHINKLKRELKEKK
ncbi:MAG: hypothetical protein IJG07_05565 [Prevotella sp.]|nr:hypothetical protein [Prevotella sp.]